MPRIKIGTVEVVLEESFIGRVRIARDGALDVRSTTKRGARRARVARPGPAGPAGGQIKVFVCHSSADEAAAAAFVALMRAALPLGAKSIRCTSVSGYKLPAGTNVDTRLRAEVFSSRAFVALMRTALPLGAKSIRCTSVSGYKLPAGTNVDTRLRAEVFSSRAFVALLSPRSIESIYVMFELGARWGAERYLVPVLIGGLPARRVEAPLRALHVVKGGSEADVMQLIGELADQLGVKAEAAAVYLKALREFTAAARPRRR
jgi:hypothetical protein